MKSEKVENLMLQVSNDEIEFDALVETINTLSTDERVEFKQALIVHRNNERNAMLEPFKEVDAEYLQMGLSDLGFIIDRTDKDQITLIHPVNEKVKVLVSKNISSVYITYPTPNEGHYKRLMGSGNELKQEFQTWFSKTGINLE